MLVLIAVVSLTDVNVILVFTIHHYKVASGNIEVQATLYGPTDGYKQEPKRTRS